MNSRENTRPTQLALGIAALSVLVTCLINRPWEGLHLRDGAYYAYLAALQAGGLAPYRDVFHLQGPVLTWLGGLAIGLAGTPGLALLGAFVSGLLTFAGVRLALAAYGRPGTVVELLPVALVAWGMTTGWPFLGAFIVSGSRPKFLAIGLAACAVHLLCTNRRVAAGAAFAAACWTWQPGAVLTVGAIAGWLAARAAERDSAAEPSVAASLAGVALGGFVVSVGALGALAVQGSFEPFLEQAVRAAPIQTERTFDLIATLHRVGLLLPLPVLLVGAAGLAVNLWHAVSPGAPRLAPDARRVLAALLGWLVAYLGLLTVDFDWRGDTVPLLLPLGVFAGVAMGRVDYRMAVPLRLTVAGILCLWLVGADRLSPIQHSPYPHQQGETLGQHAGRGALTAAKERGVLIFADPLLAQQVGEHPKHPFVFWEPGTLEYIHTTYPGGLEAFLDPLVDRRYGVVTVGPRAAALLPYLAPRLRDQYEPTRSLRPRNRTWVLRDP